MTGRHRHFAFKVLRWIGVDEAVIGDLEETYRGSQSTWSFWRQAIGAVYASLVGELRVHALSVVTCLIAGWLMVWEVAPAIGRVTITAAIRSYRSYFESGSPPSPHSGDFIWILNFAVLILTSTAGGFAAVRWHKGQRPLLAVLFAVTVMCQRMLLLFWHSTAYDSSTASLYFMFRPAGGPTVLTLIALESVAALAGGLAAVRGRQASAP